MRQPEKTTMDTIIFDIDGTLADIEHRRHFLSGAKPAWGQFYDEMINDPPLRDVCLLAELLGDHPLVNQGAIRLFLFSGRPETHRKETEEWLLIHARSYFQKAEALLMRGEGDNRADTIVKREMYDSIVAKGYDVRLVVDDRPSVVEMWKALGLTVLAHDSGDWAGVEKTWEPGALHLMIGPSGAGKSFYVEKNFFFLADMTCPRSALISYDNLRIEIAGDAADQLANAQVFFAVRAVVRARVESGLTTIVDATNLRARDRRAFRDLCPAETNIFYHVIDRPLKDKLRDAGSGGAKLVTKTHESFKSGIKHTLAGDDDPRVTVLDRRFT